MYMLYVSAKQMKTEITKRFILEIKDLFDKYILHNLLVCRLCTVIVVTAIFSILIPILFPQIPSGSDMQEWVIFTTHIDKASSENQYIMIRIGVFLICVHAIHIFLCIPFLFITKMMYGFFFGIWKGYLICVLWEVFLVTGMTNYIKVYSVIEMTNDIIIPKLYKSCHKYGPITITCAAQLSSLPLHITNSLVRMGIVTKRTFVRIHTCVTLSVSIKHVVMGHLLHNINNSNYIMFIFSILFFMSSIIPVMLTFCLFSGVLYVTSPEDMHEDIDNVSGGLLVITSPENTHEDIDSASGGLLVSISDTSVDTSEILFAKSLQDTKEDIDSASEGLLVSISDTSVDTSEILFAKSLQDTKEDIDSASEGLLVSISDTSVDTSEIFLSGPMLTTKNANP
jgi:hypothetical protein